MAAAKQTKSEDILGEKWDHCITDSITKMGGGLVIGQYLLQNQILTGRQDGICINF